MKTLALSLVLIAAASHLPGHLPDPSTAATVSAPSYYCVYPKSVTVADRTVQTPTICVPGP